MTARREFIQSMAIAATSPLVSSAVSAKPVPTKLKKSALITMLPKEMSYADRFKLALDCGFEGIEMQTILAPKEAGAIKEAADKTKLKIHSVMNMGHWEWPFSSPDAADIKRGHERMEASLRNAKLWGADCVLLVPAVVKPNVTIPEAWKRSQAEVRKLIPLAKELGVVIGIEPVWNKFLLTPYDTAKYVDEFKSPWVQAYFDVGNVVMYGFPQEWIRALGKRIARFHIKDFKFESRQFVPLREGSIDWKEIRTAINDINYNGWLTTEVGPSTPAEKAMTREAWLRETSNRVDQIIAGM